MMPGMARVGVVGLGNIGGAIAANLVADGHEVMVSDLDPARVAAVAGATGGTVAEVGENSEVTITSLPAPDVVAAVADEWAAAAHPGSVLCDISTTLPAGNQAIAARLESSGHHFVEAPLTGGAIGIGLPLTRQLVEAHGGAIALDSEPGKGTVVTIRLPRTLPDDSAA